MSGDHVNLMSPTVAIKNESRRIVMVWTTVTLIGILVVSGWAMRESIAFDQVNAKHETLEKSLDQERLNERELRRLESVLLELQQRETETVAAANRPSLMPVLGTISQAAQDSSGEVLIESFNFQSPQSVSSAQATKATLAVNGVATTHVAIAKFAAFLRNSPLFESVELKGTAAPTVSPSGKSIRSFQLIATLSLPLSRRELP